MHFCYVIIITKLMYVCGIPCV